MLHIFNKHALNKFHPVLNIFYDKINLFKEIPIYIMQTHQTM